MGRIMSEKTIVDKAGFVVGFGIAAASDVIKAVFGAAAPPAGEVLKEEPDGDIVPKEAVEKAPAEKPSQKKVPAKKAPAKKAAAKKAPAKKAVEKAPAKKAAKKSAKTHGKQGMFIRR
jgi:hypothetical protein